MAVICVAGISPGIGKTSIAEMLLADLAAGDRIVGKAHAGRGQKSI